MWFGDAEIEERAAHNKYLTLSFHKSSECFSFILKYRKVREILSRLLAEERIVFRMFSVNLEVGVDS